MPSPLLSLSAVACRPLSIHFTLLIIYARENVPFFLDDQHPFTTWKHYIRIALTASNVSPTSRCGFKLVLSLLLFFPVSIIVLLYC